MLKILFLISAFLIYQIPALIILSIKSNTKNKEIRKNLKYILISFSLIWMWMFFVHFWIPTSALNQFLNWF